MTGTVQVLEGGDAALCEISLDSMFMLEHAPPGLYALRFIGAMGENDPLVKLGCDPMQTNQTIMLIEIVEEEPFSAFQYVLPAVAVLAAAILVLAWWILHRRKAVGGGE